MIAITKCREQAIGIGAATSRVQEGGGEMKLHGLWAGDGLLQLPTATVELWNNDIDFD